MPYSSTSELPQSVRDKYSEKCQRAYMHAFNSTHEKTGDEGKAAASGHSAAQDCEGNKAMDQIDLAMYEPVTQPVPFKIFSGLLRAYRDTDGKMRLKGVASSTVRDRHGDRMEKTAIDDMVLAANDNMTIFLNHSYNVPEDVAGSVESAAAFQRGMDNEGNEIWDLDYDVGVLESNPRAVDAFNAIEKGTKLGLSIGAMIPEGGALRNKKTGAYLFQHVDLLETSIVGIPANPRSWVQNAVKALKSASTMNLGTPTLTLDGQNYRIEGTLDSTQINITNSDEPDETAKKKPVTPKPDTDQEDQNNLQSTEPDEPHPDDPDTDTDDDAADDAATEPQSTPGPDDPDVQDAKVQIITIDTDDPNSGGSGDSQGASASEPDEGSDDDVYDSTESADVSLSTTLTSSLDTLEATASALVETRRQLAMATEERDAARRERDEAVGVAKQVIAETSQIIEKLASMPVGRKAVLREARDDLGGLERLYGPEIVKLLRSKNNG